MMKLLQVFKALRVSRRLDDRRRSPMRPARDDIFAQETIDAALSDTQSLPWSAPPADCRRRVFARIEESRYAVRAPRNVMPTWPLKLSGLVAAAALALSLPVVRAPLHTAWTMLRAPVQTQTIASADSNLAEPVREPLREDEGNFDVGTFLASLPRHTSTLAAAQLDEPLRREAAALRDDTSRAARMIFGTLAMTDISESDAQQ